MICGDFYELKGVIATSSDRVNGKNFHFPFPGNEQPPDSLELN